MSPMEATTRGRKNSSGDKFSFPSINPIPTQDSDQFEFGCITPGSPNSPADHLFSNGKLLPHPFPVIQPPISNLQYSFTRSTSRTSSVSSKDSLMSSRCNSTSSRSSNSSGSCSSANTSARTSISTDYPAEKKLAVPLDQVRLGGKVGGKCYEKGGQGVLGKKQVVYVNGSSSRRWGLIPAAPVVGHGQVSRRRKGGHEIVVKKKVKVRRGGGMGFATRFLRWFVTACKECHAIKPLRAVDDVNME